MDSGIRDTAAYKIVQQILDHTRPDSSKIEDAEFLRILSGFYKRGGSWERLMDGDMRSMINLEDSIDALMEAKKLSKIALKITRMSLRK